MKFRNIIYSFLILISIALCTFYLSNSIFLTPTYKHNLYNNVIKYIKDKYGDNITIESSEFYASSKGIINTNKAEEAIITPKNCNYKIYYDIKSNKIYDSKQYKTICQAVKNKLISEYVNSFASSFGINDLSVFEATTNHFKNIQGNVFFSEDCYYYGDIITFLKQNNINLYLDVSFKNSPNISSYRDLCLKYINSVKPYFTGGMSNILVNVYKENYTNNKLSQISICEVRSYQNRDSWFENTFEENFINVSNGVYISSLLNNYYFKDIKDCCFEKIGLTDDIKNYNETTKSFNSDLYYFNYNEEEINNFNIDTSTELLVKLDKSIFEKGVLYNSNRKLYTFQISNDKNHSISCSIINSSNSYSDGKYLYINIKPDSYLVLAD